MVNLPRYRRIPSRSSRLQAVLSTPICFLIPVFGPGDGALPAIRRPPCRFDPSTLATTMPSSGDDSNNASSSEHDQFKRVKVINDASDDDGTVPVVSSTTTIGTHSGTFQADEAMGVWMLRQLPGFQRSRVVRSRDPTVLAGLDVVIDVGGSYDHESRRYDHHQRGYDERFDPNRCTKLSASGLVYRHYGRELLTTLYPNLSEAQVEWTYVSMYDTMLEALDAIDTGVEPCPLPGVQLLYRDNTGLSSRVARLNPRWNEREDHDNINSGNNNRGLKPPSEDDRFDEAVRMCGDEFMNVLTALVESDLPAQGLVVQAVEGRREVDGSGEILALPSGGMPWRAHLYDAERALGVEPPIKFVLYRDVAGMQVTIWVSFLFWPCLALV